MKQVYKLNGGFVYQQISNSFKQTAERKKGAAQSVCRPCMNSGANIYNNTMYAISTKLQRVFVAFKEC